MPVVPAPRIGREVPVRTDDRLPGACRAKPRRYLAAMSVCTALVGTLTSLARLTGREIPDALAPTSPVTERVSPVVPARADRVAHRAEQHQDEAGHDGDDAECPDDRDLRQEADNKQDDSDDDHERLHSASVSCCLPAAPVVTAGVFPQNAAGNTGTTHLRVSLFIGQLILP